jgi:hypothetical protein
MTIFDIVEGKGLHVCETSLAEHTAPQGCVQFWAAFSTPTPLCVTCLSSRRPLLLTAYRAPYCLSPRTQSTVELFSFLRTWLEVLGLTFNDDTFIPPPTVTEDLDIACARINEMTICFRAANSPGIQAAPTMPSVQALKQPKDMSFAVSKVTFVLAREYATTYTTKWMVVGGIT